MRIISGTVGGRRIVAPKSECVRPVLDQVKEAIFNILFDVTGARVLDCFAGSGSVGLEALSRGAKFAVFVDDFGPSIMAIRKNLASLGFEKRADVLAMDAMRAIARLSKRGETFDLIFVDPPYLKDLVNPTLQRLAESPIIAEGARIVVEHHPKEPVKKTEGLVLTKTRKYGQTLVSFLKSGK